MKLGKPFRYHNEPCQTFPGCSIRTITFYGCHVIPFHNSNLSSPVLTFQAIVAFFQLKYVKVKYVLFYS